MARHAVSSSSDGRGWRYAARRGLVAALVLACVLAMGAGTARAAFGQGPPPEQGRRPDGRLVSPGEVQQLFDAYLLMQAQRALQLTDAQYPEFLIRMKTLLGLRRKNELARFAILRELRQMTDLRGPQATDAQVKAELQKLRDFDASAALAMQKAYTAVDQLLDVRQQARLLVFEQQMERRKLELLMRARGMRRPDFHPHP
ncbi:MAG TPA: hypothetical protein VNE16_12405 [Vicinamibacterales bacterium]|nr:hypothetical protein [Vicinamibacterales bacterium]